MAQVIESPTRHRLSFHDIFNRTKRHTKAIITDPEPNKLSHNESTSISTET